MANMTHMVELLLDRWLRQIRSGDLVFEDKAGVWQATTPEGYFVLVTRNASMLDVSTPEKVNILHLDARACPERLREAILSMRFELNTNKSDELKNALDVILGDS